MNKKVVWSVVIVIIAIIIIAIVSKDPSNSGSKDTIIIGATESLTGSAAYYGESSRKGMDLGIDFLKKEYPNTAFEIYHEDNQFNPKIAVDAYNKLRASYDIDAIITQNSPSAIVIEPLAKKDGILQMAVSASAEKYTSPDDLSFRMTAGSNFEVMPMIEFINKNYKRVAILYMNNEIGMSEASSLQKGLEKNSGLMIVSHDSFPVETNDFRTLLTKIKVGHPDAIYIAGLASHINNFLKQMKELDVSAKVLTFRTGEDPVLLSNSGELAEGVIFTSNFDPESKDAEALRFVSDYENKYGQKPDSYAAEGYEGMRFVGMAFAKCNRDYDCIKDYLINIKNYPTVFGNISFNNNGDIEYDFFLKTVKNGKFVKYE